MSKGSIIAFSALGVVLIGGYLYYKNQVDKLTSLGFKPIRYRFTGASLDLVKMEIDVQITNTSNISGTITGYDIDAKINDTIVGKIKSAMNQPIGANQSSVVTINVAFGPKIIVKNIFSVDTIKTILTDRSKIKLSLSGYVSIKAINALQLSNIAVDYSSTLDKIAT